MTVSNQAQKSLTRATTSLLAHAGPSLVQVPPVRRAVVSRVEKWLHDASDIGCKEGRFEPGVAEDRFLIGKAIVSTVERALAGKRLSPAALHGMTKILVQSLFIEQGDQSAAARFRVEHQAGAPTFLVISPGKSCNLRCTGCYADSGPTAEKLEWATFERIVTEAKTLWGTRFFVISGGEPFAYRSEDKGVLDMAERHPDCLFMAYSNGTLIDGKATERLARAGNLWPAISVEGWRERTDARRGEGVFARVIATMDRLRMAQVPFGVSLTATRHNVEEILSDEFVNYFFEEQGALFGWIFHYMPIGRSFTLDLMPTPEQRLWMWRRSWEIIREKRHFLVDFWNHGTACDGCLSAGGHGAGGYMYVDWNGAVSPCVFMPYSPLNVKDVYARGGTMNDVWADPFFASLRSWQADFQSHHRNEMAPCPIRDHNVEFRRLLVEHEPDPTDENARVALLDGEYAQGLAQYDVEYQAMADQVWQQHYVRPGNGKHNGDRPIEALPDITGLVQAPALTSTRDDSRN